MSTFEKIVIPLMSDEFKSTDFTEACGFVDCYTCDPDKPTASNEFFIVYDDKIRNEFSIERARRFDKSPLLKRTYIKYVDGNPRLVYSFWVKPDIGKLYKGVQNMTASQKVNVMNFWGPFDRQFSEFLVGNSTIGVDWKHDMPIADYIPSDIEEQKIKDGIL